MSEMQEMQEMPNATSTSNTGDYLLMIGIKLSNAQIQSIQNHKLDFEKIKNLQQLGQWPDTSKAPVWKAGNNFGSAVLVGYRKNPDTGNNDAVYLKTDGWFTTPEDLTNCNPITDETGNDIFVDGQGYEFGDMSAVAAKKGALTLKQAADNLSTRVAGLSGGKTQKRKYKRKSKASRRYRK